MKTAISVPDRIFKAADRLAKRLRVSRSELYAKAMEAYVAKYDEEAIIESLNRAYADDEGIDPVLQKAQERALDREQW